MTRGEKFVVIIAGTLLVLLAYVSAFAGDCNGPGEDECCQVGGETLPIEVVCTNVVEANPEAFCAAVAVAECETATTVLIEETKASCDQAQANSFLAVQTCGDVSLACPSCPSTLVQDTISRCKSVKVLRNGTIRKRGCVSFLSATEAVCE